MIDESKWINPIHGMELTPYDDFKGKRHQENGILQLVQYYIMKKVLGTLTEADKNKFWQICKDLRTYKKDGIGRYEGLFDRGAKETQDPILRKSARTISHDNLTAISRCSNDVCVFSFDKEIAKELLRQKGIMDNIQPWKPRLLYRKQEANKTVWTSRLQHPRDWHYWLYNGGYKKLSMVFYPIFALANIITSIGNAGETSGKLLIFTRLFQRKEWHYKILYKICAKNFVKTYGPNWLSAITGIYYWQSGQNPLRILATQIEEKGLL